MKTKKCKTCKKDKPLTEFKKHSLGKFGVIAHCKVCYKEKEKEYQKVHYAKHREEIIARTSAYNAANKEQRAAYMAEWNQQTKDDPKRVEQKRKADAAYRAKEKEMLAPNGFSGSDH